MSRIHDIALVVSSKPFRIGTNIRMICLATGNSFLNDNHLVVSGWGRNSSRTGTYQDTLRKTNLVAVSHDSCEEDLRSAALGRYFFLDKNMMCAGGTIKCKEAHCVKTVCRGDDGGPLISAESERTNKFVQVGIASWGLKCDYYSAPAVFVDVRNYITWIDYELSKRGFDTNLYKDRYNN